MKALFHSVAALSIGLFSAIPAAAAPASPYYGRWTINMNPQVFTAKGRMYRTIDIAPCGKDFCGVSVGAKGQCGPVLFRFLARHANGETELRGHAKWGTATKNVQIGTWKLDTIDWPGGRKIDLFVGDGYNFSDRSDNMPKFHGEYRRTGTARCTAQ